MHVVLNFFRICSGISLYVTHLQDIDMSNPYLEFLFKSKKSYLIIEVCLRKLSVL